MVMKFIESNKTNTEFEILIPILSSIIVQFYTFLKKKIIRRRIGKSGT